MCNTISLSPKSKTKARCQWRELSISLSLLQQTRHSRSLAATVANLQHSTRLAIEEVSAPNHTLHGMAVTTCCMLGSRPAGRIWRNWARSNQRSGLLIGTRLHLKPYLPQRGKEAAAARLVLACCRGFSYPWAYWVGRSKSQL